MCPGRFFLRDQRLQRGAGAESSTPMMPQTKVETMLITMAAMTPLNQELM